MKKTLKKLIDVKNWNKKTKIYAVIVGVLIIVAIILGCIKPSEEEMLSNASEKMQQLVERDETSTRKRVTITYNSLGIINYCSFSTSGAEELSEKFIGFAGDVYSADDGVTKIIGQNVNYT